MLKFLATAGFLGLGSLPGLTTFERATIYPLDPTWQSPETAGVALQEARLTMADNTEIITWVSPPTGGKPVVLYFPGNAGNLAARARRFNWITDRGYGLVAMAYRGSSGSGGVPGEQVIRSDANELWARMPELTGAPEAFVVVYGESIGAAVSVALVAGLPVDEQPAGLVLEAGFTSVPDLIRRKYQRFRPLVLFLNNRWPSERRIRKVASPLLILHGTNDQLIPLDMSQSLLSAAASSDKELFEVQGAGHSDVWQPDTTAKIALFLSNTAFGGSEN